MHNLNILLARRMGILGVVPFAFISLLAWIVHPDWLPYLIRAQLYYGIAILSFLGGLHWGVALCSTQNPSEQVRKALIWGIVPTIIAWCSMIDTSVGFLVQIVGFIVAYKVDKHLYRLFNLPDWFLVLRLQLTRLVVAALAFTFLAVNVRAFIS